MNEYQLKVFEVNLETTKQSSYAKLTGGCDGNIDIGVWAFIFSVPVILGIIL